MAYRLRRRRGGRRYSLSKQTRRYAYALIWLVIAVGLITTTGLLSNFLPNANPSITIGETSYTIPVTTIGQVVLGFLGLFAMFKFIQLIGIRM